MDREELLAKFALNADQMVEAATKLGVAYLGAKAAGHWTGALTGLIALKLAQGGNLIAGASGVGVLALIGATSMYIPGSVGSVSKTDPPLSTLPGIGGTGYEPPVVDPGTGITTKVIITTVSDCRNRGEIVQILTPTSIGPGFTEPNCRCRVRI